MRSPQKILNSSNQYRVGILFLFILYFSYSLTSFIEQWPFQPLRMLSASEHFYLAQQVASGSVLYRDYAYNKTPLIIYICAMCFLVCQKKLFASVVLIRFIFWGMYFSAALPVYMIAKEFLKRNYLPLLCILLYLGFPFAIHHIAGEPDWHILMNTCGLFSLAFVLRKRFVASGACASLAFLSWQPGLGFLITIIFVKIFFPSESRVRDIRDIMWGFAFPILIFVVYFSIRGSLIDFLSLTIVSTQNNIELGFLHEMKLIPRYVRLCYFPFIPAILLSLFGFLLHSFSIFRLKDRDSAALPSRLLFAITSITVIYSLIDFQHCDDFLPFVPWISLYAVYPIKFFLKIPRNTWGKILAIGVVVLLFTSLKNTFVNPVRVLKKVRDGRLSYQIREQKETLYKTLYDHGYEESDEITCIETALPCLLTGKKNSYAKYIYFLDNYYTPYIQKHDFDSVALLFESIRFRRPKFIFTLNNLWERRQHKKWGGRFKNLLDQNYQLHEQGRLHIYRRK